MSDESDENGLFQDLDPQEMSDNNSEINSSDFEDVSDAENDIICGFCQNPNAKIFTNLYDERKKMLQAGIILRHKEVTK